MEIQIKNFQRDSRGNGRTMVNPTRYLCLECDMWKKRGTIFRGFKFICSDCDLTYWREQKKWSNDGRVYYANISTKST